LLYNDGIIRDRNRGVSIDRYGNHQMARTTTLYLLLSLATENGEQFSRNLFSRIDQKSVLRARFANQMIC